MTREQGGKKGVSSGEETGFRLGPVASSLFSIVSSWCYRWWCDEGGSGYGSVGGSAGGGSVGCSAVCFVIGGVGCSTAGGCVVDIVGGWCCLCSYLRLVVV